MSTEKILVIDDEPSIVRLCQLALGRQGFQVDGAPDGRQGLRRVREGGYGLILLDINLPDRDGLDMLNTIQELDPEAGVIIITGDSTLEVATRAARSGAQDFLIKPFGPTELVASLHKVREKQRLLQENLRLQARLPILEISKALISETNPERLARLALDIVQQELGADRVSLMLLDEQAQELFIADALGLSETVVANTRVKIGEGLAGLAAQNAEPMLVSVDSQAEFTAEESLTQRDTGSAICVPLVLQTRVLGVLNASRTRRGNSFRQDDVDLLSILCGQITVAFENARLFEQAQIEIAERERAQEALWRRNQELTALNTIATTISQSMDLDHILSATLEKVLDVTQTEAGWIQLLRGNGGPDTLRLIAHRGLSARTIQEIETARSREGPVARVIRSGQPVVVPDVSDIPWLDAVALGHERKQTFAGVPIQAMDRTLGVLSILGPRSRELVPHGMQLLVAIGHQIGMAVENVRLIDEASEIQILRELDRLRSELIANVSHELRTPLGLIKIFCTTLLRTDVELDQETVREFLYNIEEETDRLEEIVTNLLDMSRMESGRLHLDKQRADLGQLTAAVLENIEIQLERHTVVPDFPDEPLMAMVDIKRMEQVLRNLLSNACKYSPDGGTITVQGRGDKSQVLLRVNDQGIGIPPEETGRIFERFYRVENEVTQNVGGVGLGLAVCRGIVKAHGGRIWVESQVGTGSTFYLSLPVDVKPRA